MYCPSCGMQVEDGSLFCSECGTNLANREDLSAPSGIDSNFETVPLTSFPTEMSPAVMPAAVVGVSQPLHSATPNEVGFTDAASFGAGSSSAPSPSYDSIRSSLSGQQYYQDEQDYAPKQKSNKSQTALLIGAAAAMVLLLAVLFGIGAKGSGGIGAEDAYADFVTVDFALDPEGGVENMSAVPMHITGTDKDGNKVDTKVAYKPNSSAIKLRPGHYIAKLFSPPISANNKLFEYPDKEYPFEVPSKSSQSSSAAQPLIVAKDDPIPLKEKEATPEEVEKAKEVIDTLPPKIESPSSPTSSKDQGSSSQDTSSASSEKNIGQSSSETPVVAPGETDEQRKAREKEEAREAALKNLEEEKQKALDANPAEVKAAPSKSSDWVILTGTVEKHEAYSEPEKKDVTIYTFELPKELTLTGTQYENLKYSTLILNEFENIDAYVGETIQINTQLSARITASIPQAQFSPLYCNSPEFKRDFKLNGFVVSDDKGVGYCVVTDYYEFDIPEYWRGKVDCTFSGRGSLGGWAQDAVQETIIVAKDSKEPFADIVCVPQKASELYEENNYFSDATMTMAMLKTDAYTVPVQWYKYYLHLEDPTNVFMTLSTGKENDKGVTGDVLQSAAQDFFTQNLVSTVKVKNGKGDLEEVGKAYVASLAEKPKEEANQESDDSATSANPSSLTADEISSAELVSSASEPEPEPKPEPEPEEVAAQDDNSGRKAEIEQNARVFLEFLYNNRSSNRISNEEFWDLTNNGSLQSGWPATSDLTYNRFEAVDDNTVEYDIRYYTSLQMPGAMDWEWKDGYGTITFDEQGHIDIWLPDGMTNNRLIR